MGISRREFVGMGAAVVACVGSSGIARAGSKNEYRGLSTPSAKGADSGRDDGFSGTANGERSGVSIRSAGAGRGLLAGCAVNVRALRADASYKKLLQEQVGIVVGESEFKFGPLRPSPTTYFFDDADFLAAFAAANGMKLRGHNFVWHRQLPGWFESYVTPANAERVLVEHIEKVGGRYAGKIHSWDVVNEAVQVSDGLAGGFRDSPWQKVLGGGGDVPKYIEVAFRTARRVDPKALLIYNDYGIEGEDEASAKKRAAVMGLLRAMQKKGVPLDGLGVQSHISAVGKDGKVPVYGAGLMRMLEEVRGMGLRVLVTEMDVNERYVAAEVGPRDAAVAAMYGSYLGTVLQEPAVIAVLTWGITDKYTWLNGEDARTDGEKERPLPFDAEMQPVAAFGAEVRALAGAPGRG